MVTLQLIQDSSYSNTIQYTDTERIVTDTAVQDYDNTMTYMYMYYDV